MFAQPPDPLARILSTSGSTFTNARTRAVGRLAVGVDLYEYQGKELFRRVGIPVSEGRLATAPAEARAAAEELGGPVVVKAQVLTGGRGKAGGVKLATTPDEAEARAADILGLDIKGHVVKRVWIEQASDIAKEYYLSLTFDRGVKQPLFMFTTAGGVDIEQVAEETPEALVQLHVDPLEGFHPWQARSLVYGAGVTDPSEQKQIAAIIGQLHDAFTRFDAMSCEVNPLIVTPDGQVKALDSKFTVDDNALYRHPDVAEMRDLDAADPLEALAREKNVTYVRLDGDVGVLGNGAGLTMSTVDVVTFAGGRPANFCDLGGGGDAQGVVDALEVITRDPQVKAIFFNIFGGITRCDEVAKGILQALSEMKLTLPIVVRLDGTNRKRAGASSPTRLPRTCTSRPRCSRLHAWPWSWRHERCVVGSCRALRGIRRPPRGRGSRPARRLGGRRRHRSRRRDRRRARRPQAPGGGARGDHLGSGARNAPRCRLQGRGASVRRRQLRHRRLPHRRASLPGRPQGRPRDGARDPSRRAPRRHGQHG